MKLIPGLIDRPPPNDEERNLLALPARHGGIALSNPTADADTAFSASITIAGPLKDAILLQSKDYSYDVLSSQLSAKSTIQKLRRQQSKQQADALKQNLPDSLKRAMDLASEKGASSWLTTLPKEENGFTLHKGAFEDALALRYGRHPSRVPSNCSCDSTFSVEHTFFCNRGGFTILRHNELRDLTASLLTKVFHEVSVEPELQSINGESFNGATTSTHPGWG